LSAKIRCSAHPTAEDATAKNKDIIDASSLQAFQRTYVIAIIVIEDDEWPENGII